MKSFGSGPAFSRKVPMTKVAAVQVSSSGDAERNLKKAIRYLEVAADRGAQLACFPELFAAPWFLNGDVDPYPLAQRVDGPDLETVAECSRRLGIAVVFPFFERSAEGGYYNSAAVFDRDGERRGVYRKVHLPELAGWQEKTVFTPGDVGFPVFEVAGLQVGVQLGWDNFFPEGFRALALAGAEIAVLGSAAAYASHERWLAMAVSHAVANGCYVVRVNRVGSEAGLDFYGHTFAVRPDGELCADPIDLGDGVLMVECDPDLVTQARRNWPFLRDRRPRQYTKIVGMEWGANLLDSAKSS